MTQQPYPHLTTFLRAFGQPARQTACACERREEVSLDQALQLMNGELVRAQVAQGAKRLEPLSNEELVQHLYWSAFSRPPRSVELEAIRRHLETASHRGQAIEDIVWSLINTNEFMFQH